MAQEFILKRPTKQNYGSLKNTFKAASSCKQLARQYKWKVGHFITLYAKIKDLK